MTSAGDNVPTPLNLSLGINVSAGELVAFYVTLVTTTAINYTNGTTTGVLFTSDANMEFYEGAGLSYPFTSNFNPRIWNGNINYTPSSGGVSTTIDFTCADLGSNQIEVTVTDDSGNVATCIATVNVNDITAPIITCGPSSNIVGSTTDNPALAIIDNSTVSATMTVTDDVSIVDLDVVLDIDHTWTGDMQITLESPAGTQVLIFNGASDGCSADDIITTLDDESANPLDCDPGGNGNAFPLPDYVPSNALSAFDGEGTMGDWILSIEDTAGGDQGTLNSWSLVYTSVNTMGNVIIELDENGMATIDPFDIINSAFDACGITISAVDITDVDCDDIGTTLVVTVFVSDSSGNIASCQAMVDVVDLLPPVVTCPPDQTVDPGPGNLFWVIEDYFGTGAATATDNCTDPLTIFSQDPAPGTLLPDGVYTVTMSSTDEYGNVGSCTFELTVESILGVEDNKLDNAIVIYPNPARDIVIFANTSGILLNQAVIYDVNGRQITTIDLSDMQQEKTVDVSNLSSGVYMVQFQSDDASTVKRLVKE